MNNTKYFNSSIGKLEFDINNSCVNPIGILLLTHGFPADSNDWKNFENFFSDKYVIIRPNYFVVYENCKGNLFDLQSIQIAELINFYNSYSLPVYLVGHDLGCFLNYKIAEKLNFQIKAMININGLCLEQYFYRLKNFSFKQLLKSSYVFPAQSQLIQNFVKKYLHKIVLKSIYKLSKVPNGHFIYENSINVLEPIYIYESPQKDWTKKYCTA